MEQDEAPNPRNILLFRAVAVVPQTNGEAHLIE
jgi:hypothetical protein